MEDLNISPAGPIVSILVNAFGCRAVTMIGGVIVMAGTLMSAFAPSINFIVMSLGFVTGKKLHRHVARIRDR